jgi:hypothetical protein
MKKTPRRDASRAGGRPFYKTTAAYLFPIHFFAHVVLL